MEPSPELEAFGRRRVAAFNSGDTMAQLDLYADDPHLTVIGSDPDEWWSGYATVRDILTSILPELRAVDATVDVEHVEAFSEGTVGWLACRLVMRSSSSSTSMRYTAVLRRDGEEWEIVQSHLSQGTDNEDTFGVRLSKVEQLATAVRVEQPDLTETAAGDGTITIGFSDMESSTERAVQLGDRAWLDLVRWHDRLVTECVGEVGGRVVKSLGDGHMLAFSSASDALCGSISILRSLRDAHDREALRMRIGLHSGDVLR